MKILLLQPPLNPTMIGTGTSFLTEPLALEILAASVPEHEVRILDMRIENALSDTISAFRPELVGITSLTTDVYIAKRILSEVKGIDKSIFTVIGGHHATMIPHDFCEEYIDAVAIGDGEETFRDLVKALERRSPLQEVAGLAVPCEGKLVFTAKRASPQDLDALPFPNRTLTGRYRKHYFRGTWRPLASLMTSKGCPFRCSFCAMWKLMEGKYKTRSAESVIKELKSIQEPYIDFAEDNFFHDIKRAENIHKLIKEEGIKKSYKLYARSDTVVRHPDIIGKWKDIGMELILVGLESHTDKGLQGLHKSNSIANNEKAVRILQKNGVEIVSYFIVEPSFKEKDFKELGDYVVNLGLNQPIFTVLTPLPGTELYESKYNELETHNYEHFDFIHSVLPTALPRKEFYQCLFELYKKTYSASVSRDSGRKQTFDADLQAKFMGLLLKAGEAKGEKYAITAV